MSSAQNGPAAARDHADRVSAVIRAAWAEHRLVPRLFRAGDQLVTGQTDITEVFGCVELAPAELLLRASNDHLWRDLGRDLAVGEVRDLLDRLAQASQLRQPEASLRRQVSGILADMNSTPGGTTILVPPRTGITNDLELPRPPDPADPRSQGSSWYRGAFESVAVFAVPMTPIRPVWIVDFDRLGEARLRGGVDDLEITIEPYREGLVRLGDSMVPGVAITMRTYVEVEIQRPASAVGIDVKDPAEDAAA